LASFGIGAKLRQERVGKGLAIDDISRDTRIAPRFLEAIETDDYSSLPGLVFTRNFVRQYALRLQLDPDPLLAELPKLDESTAPLPNPPPRPRSSYHRDRQIHSLVSSIVWLTVLGVAATAVYMRFGHSGRTSAIQTRTAQAAAVPPAVTNPVPQSTAAVPTNAADGTAPQAQLSSTTSQAPSSSTAPVQVSLRAHDQATWIQVSADGKITFTGTLKPNETKEVSAIDQVKVLTGNAGALTISLNGKTLESIGPLGQPRTVRLTAEGPRLLSKAPQPASDPL
jgi:cytoskeleton protein RodZ